MSSRSGDGSSVANAAVQTMGLRRQWCSAKQTVGMQLRLTYCESDMHKADGGPWGGHEGVSSSRSGNGSLVANAAVQSKQSECNCQVANAAVQSKQSECNCQVANAAVQSKQSECTCQVANAALHSKQSKCNCQCCMRGSSGLNRLSLVRTASPRHA